MKDLTHYFGQSPKSDESSSSLKENEAVNASAVEITAVKKPASSDVLQCKTPGNNVNDTESPKHTPADPVSKTQVKDSSTKRKLAAKKKPSVTEDEDFEVKPKKKRGKPKKVMKAGGEVPLIKPDSDSVIEQAKVEASSSEMTVDQSDITKEEGALVSPTPQETVSESKVRSVKDITHFFSPTKKTESNADNKSNADQQSPSASAVAKKEDKAQSGRREGSSKVPVRKNTKKVKEETSGSKPDSTKNNNKSFSKNDKVSADSNTESHSEEKCEQKQMDVKGSVCNAFQMLMSKKQNSQASTDANDTPKNDKEQPSKELPEDDDDFEEKTPKAFAKRKKRNRIESDTDDDCQPEDSNQHKKAATEAEAPATQDESKRKSLMNYFQKISKEEAEVQSQKVQFQVEAIVHQSDGSPYKSKSKKETATQRVPKKKKVKQKRNENEIEWLGSEVITVQTPKKIDPVPRASDEIGNKGEEGKENVTTVAEKEFNSSPPKKGKRTLKLSSSSSPRSKRPKKPVDEGKEIELPPENAQVDETVDLKAPDSEKLNSKTPAKKMKQVPLGSNFFKKEGPVDSISPDVKVDSPKSETPIMKSFPTVSLKQMSPRKLKKASNAKEVFGKSPKKEAKSEVIVSCDDSEARCTPRKSSRGIFAESPVSPKQPPSDMLSPATRSWKMRVCLTPKAESKESPSTTDAPKIANSGGSSIFSGEN